MVTTRSSVLFTLHPTFEVRCNLKHGNVEASRLTFQTETVDKAAEFLANKPQQLEDRIREKEKHNPKFCFLNPTDPYHAYYQFKLNEAREGKGKSLFRGIHYDCY